MIRLFNDYNALSVTHRAWLLMFRGRELDDALVTELRLKRGDRVLLFQDEGEDDEWEGVLDFGPANAPASDIEAVWYVQL
ncbi:hypothetical protein [Brevundimonas subvibrioides]|uniref:hypothetical protein n=1 Tax=Brevundimonas subvibrioides TaxID=74313 RepID=UPI0022B48BE9|nr:hypothetical protein [Brevundimonas subvibrioides]